MMGVAKLSCQTHLKDIHTFSTKVLHQLPSPHAPTLTPTYAAPTFTPPLLHTARFIYLAHIYKSVPCIQIRTMFIYMVQTYKSDPYL